MGEELALFPLGTVLLPGAPLPLRIFEPRYRRLLADVTGPDGPGRFGVVALTSGLEVDSSFVHHHTEFADVGTVAEIIEVEELAGGSFALLAVGSRRFRVTALLEATPYARAEVDYLDEVLGDLPESLPDAARALGREYQRLLSRLTGAEVDADAYPVDAVALSYRIALDAPLALDDRQSLLAEPTATARLLRLVRLLRREVVLLRQTRSVAVAPGVLNATLRPN